MKTIFLYIKQTVPDISIDEFFHKNLTYLSVG